MTGQSKRGQCRISGSNCVRLNVVVQPRASRNHVEFMADGRLRVALTAPPVEGEANKSLISFLAGLLRIPKSAVRIISGEKSRQKVLELTGFQGDEIVDLLRKAP